MELKNAFKHQFYNNSHSISNLFSVLIIIIITPIQMESPYFETITHLINSTIVFYYQDSN
jgi:hypothetical protein